VSVRLSVCFHELQLLDQLTLFDLESSIACVWVMVIACRRLKVEVMGQSQCQGLEVGRVSKDGNAVDDLASVVGRFFAKLMLITL